jgi:hypothetical protein
MMESVKDFEFTVLISQCVNKKMRTIQFGLCHTL